MTKKEKEYYISLINELRKLPTEIEWVEFKENNDAPNVIGERWRISCEWLISVRLEEAVLTELRRECVIGKSQLLKLRPRKTFAEQNFIGMRH